MRIRNHFLFADKGTEDRTHGKQILYLIYDFEEQQQSVIVLGFYSPHFYCSFSFAALQTLFLESSAGCRSSKTCFTPNSSQTSRFSCPRHQITKLGYSLLYKAMFISLRQLQRETKWHLLDFQKQESTNKSRGPFWVEGHTHDFNLGDWRSCPNHHPLPEPNPVVFMFELKKLLGERNFKRLSETLKKVRLGASAMDAKGFIAPLCMMTRVLDKHRYLTS